MRLIRLIIKKAYLKEGKKHEDKYDVVKEN